MEKQFFEQPILNSPYVKNHGLGLEVPYVYGSEKRTYIPDFIVKIDDRPPHELRQTGGQGSADPLNLIVEIKGYRREDAKIKKETMETYWVPGVNHLGTHGRWAFAEFTDIWEMQENFAAELQRQFDQMIRKTTRTILSPEDTN